MTESLQNLQANGAGFTVAPEPSSGGAGGGFSAAEGWDNYYDFTAAGIEGEGATGYIPMPSQTKIENFQRKMAKLFVDLDAAGEREKDARAQEFAAEAAKLGEQPRRTPEEQMAEIEEAIKLKREVFDKFRDALANVCSGSPSRAVLGKLNDPVLIRFINHVGDLLNPKA